MNMVGSWLTPKENKDNHDQQLPPPKPSANHLPKVSGTYLAHGWHTFGMWLKAV